MLNRSNNEEADHGKEQKLDDSEDDPGHRRKPPLSDYHTLWTVPAVNGETDGEAAAHRKRQRPDDPADEQGKRAHKEREPGPADAAGNQFRELLFLDTAADARRAEMARTKRHIAQRAEKAPASFAREDRFLIGMKKTRCIVAGNRRC